MSELIFEGDEVNLIAVCLDGKSLASFSCTSRSISENLKSPETLRWLADLRGLSSLGISSVEHLELAEIMASVTSNIYFNWGSMDVDRRVHPSLERLALAMSRHPSLCISIEAHCGLEARFAMPLPEQARDFTRARADAVRSALVRQAADADVPLDESRIKTRAWGCSRPLVWCFGQPGMAEPYDPEGAARNRRVELYLKSGGFEVPARRKRSEIPRPPGEPPLEDIYLDVSADGSRVLALDDNDDDGTADAGASLDQLVTVTGTNGVEYSITLGMLMQIRMQMEDAQMPVHDDEDEDEEGFEYDEAQHDDDDDDDEAQIRVH